MIKKISLAMTSLSSLFLWITIASAEPMTNPSSNLFFSFRVGINDYNDPAFVIATVIRILIGLIGFVSLLYLILGGYQFLTAGANPDLAKKGRTTATNAIIGLIIVILSYIITTVVVNVLTGAPFRE